MDVKLQDYLKNVDLEKKQKKIESRNFIKVLNRRRLMFIGHR